MACALRRNTGKSSAAHEESLMQETSFAMERAIARCRVFLSVVSILALYIDPTTPTLTRWLPMNGGAFTVDPHWGAVLSVHLIYSVVLLYWVERGTIPSARLATFASWLDVLFAAAIALVTEGTTSPFYAFFAFAALAAGLRSGMLAAVVVTAVSVGLYTIIILVSLPTHQTLDILMRGAYIAITGNLVGYLGEERLKQEARLRRLEALTQREQIARSLHDGYAQALAGVNLRLESVRELWRRGQHDDAMAELRELQQGVNREHDDLRGYIRSLVALEAAPLADAVGGDATRVSVQADFEGAAGYVEHVLFIMLEGTRNIRRHAQAQGATIRVSRLDDGVALALDDDGIGFPAGAAPPWSMVSRVAECGGRLSVRGPGRPGAHLFIELPPG
jgi:signal transduction histidine kinase